MTQVVGVLRGAKWKRMEEVETLRSSEKAGKIYPSTQRNIPEDVNLKKNANFRTSSLVNNFRIGSFSLDYLKHYSVQVQEMSIRLKR
jgi:hypothetical protein